MSDAYSFRTRWLVPASRQRCWAEIERAVTGGAAPWWRALRIDTSARVLAPGVTIGMTVRAPLGYRLRCALRITAVGEGQWLTGDSDGDLVGTGRIDVAAHAQGAEVRFAWDVRARRRWMRVLGPVLWPVFAAAHTAVMRAGERGLRRALAGDASGIRNPPNPSS